MAFKEKNQASSEEPLHLFIQGPKEQNLECKNIIICFIDVYIFFNYLIFVN